MTTTPQTFRTLHIDCEAGIAGDMFLAAGAGLGVDLSPLEQLLNAAGLELTLQLHTQNRASGIGYSLTVEAPHAQPLRHLPDILHIIDQLECSATIKQRSREAFTRLAQAEAHVHGCSIEEIHFHEVGAIDTIADIVGAFWLLEHLQIASVTSSALPWFSGTIQCEHGTISLPAPATLELMRGLPVIQTNSKEELVTPTGALLLASVLTYYATPETAFQSPRGRIMQSGTGYGTRPSERGLRLTVFQQDATSACSYNTETVVVLESHIDHLTGEELGSAISNLMQAGALDVLWLPGVMKKNRPGGALRVLCREQDQQILVESFFTHTHTLGIRRCRMERLTVPRYEDGFLLAGETIPAKGYTLQGKQYCRPEHDALQAASKANNTSAPGFRFARQGNGTETA